MNKRFPKHLIQQFKTDEYSYVLNIVGLNFK
jgi:hypothetical protein